MHKRMKYIYVGIDIHRNTHTAVIINCFCEKLGEIIFNNKPSAFNDFIKEVKSYLNKGISPTFGLEDTGGSGRSLAIFLTKHKYMVKKVDASLSYSERKNQAIIHKTDSYDAFCVAKVLLNNFDSLPKANPIDVYWSIASLVKRRTAVVKNNTALKNQLHSNLIYHYPSYKKFFTVIDSKTALAFFKAYPSPSCLHGVSTEEVAKLLRDNSSSFYGHHKALEILNHIKTDGDTTCDHQSTRDLIIRTTIRQYNNNKEELKEIDQELQRLLSMLDYKLETMIGISTITACYFIAEIGDIERFTSSNKLAKYAGVSPITFASGTKSKRYNNRQGNRQLYHLFHNLAARNICCGRNKDKPVNGIFYDYYQKKISEGKTKHQALICVMRRLVNIIYGMMKNKTEYVHPKLTTDKKVI